MSTVAGSVERPADNWVAWSNLNPSLYSAYVCSITFLSGSLSYPFYIITTRRQAGIGVTGDTTSSGKNISIINTIRKLGVRGIFRGVIFSNAFYIPSSLTYLTVTEYTRQQVNRVVHGALPNLSIEYCDAIQVIVSGSCANFASLLLSNPGNVVLTQLVVQPTGSNMTLSQIAQKIKVDRGWKGYTLGFGSNFTHGVTASAVWWWSYTTARRLCVSRQVDEVYVDGLSGLIAGVTCAFSLHPIDRKSVV